MVAVGVSREVNHGSFISRVSCRVVHDSNGRSEACAPHVPTPPQRTCSQEILIGVLVGGGGTIAATEGADVDLPAATILRIRIDQPLEIVVGE